MFIFCAILVIFRMSAPQGDAELVEYEILDQALIIDTDKNNMSVGSVQIIFRR